MDLKQSLTDKLTEKELSYLKTGFDIIGDIAILEIPDELRKKEKLIAKTLIKIHKNIKTVYKKSGERKGVYRLRKIKKILGNGPETMHKESGCLFKMDVEKTYFSVRESTERLRISEKIKPRENILVLFSGVGPFGIVAAKNHKDSKIDMVEINPMACKYAQENIGINRVSENVRSFCGNANKVLPSIGMENIGIKSDWGRKTLGNMLKSGAKIIEFHLQEGDLENKSEKIRNSIKFLNGKGVRVLVHQPTTYSGKEIILGSEKDFKTIKLAAGKLLETIKGFNNCIGIIMQPTMTAEDLKDCAKESLKENINKLSEIYPEFNEKVFIENIFPKVNAKKEEIEYIVNEAGLKNICLDTAHFTNTGYSTKDLLEFIEKMSKKVRIYFHIADSVGKIKDGKDCVNLGKGKIEFKKIAHLMNFGIIETYSKDFVKGKEIIEDYFYFSKLKQKRYDRIIMPLPETAYKYLDLALENCKTGGAIHLYSILGKSGDEIEKEIKKHKNLKILDKRNVLPYAPGVWKVCFDMIKT